MSAVDSSAGAAVNAPANSNVARPSTKRERRLLIAFFATLAIAMSGWLGLLLWAFLWLLGLA